MKAIIPYTQIFQDFDGEKVLKKIELCGRTCYQSEHKITDDSAAPFVRGLIHRGHEAMLEHQSVTVKFVVDRGISHEIVRHRLSSFAQESTRYCNYSKDKFGSEIAVIANEDVKEDNLYGLLGVPYSGVRKDLTAAYVWEYANKTAQWAYMTLIDLFGWSPQQARRILPLDTATTIYHTAFESDWKDFMDKRWAGKTGKPHPDMLLITKQLKELLNYED